MFKIDEIVPRINGALIGRYIGKSVHLVGEISDIDDDGNTGIIIATDNKEIHVEAINKSVFDFSNTSRFVEITGIVTNDRKILMQHCLPLPGGNKFEPAIYNEMIKLANNRFSIMFYIN